MSSTRGETGRFLAAQLKIRVQQWHRLTLLAMYIGHLRVESNWCKHETHAASVPQIIKSIISCLPESMKSCQASILAYK